MLLVASAREPPEAFRPRKSAASASPPPTPARAWCSISPAPVTHKAFLLDDPARVVLDVRAPHSRPKLRAARGHGRGHRRCARASCRSNGLRLVFEVNGPVTIQTSTRRARRRCRHRLVLDIDGARCTQAWSRVTPGAPVAPVAIRPAHAPSDTGRDIIIAIDAGHGGVDPGASGRRGTREKDVVLASRARRWRRASTRSPA